MTSTAIVWFRRDLRVHDHPALSTGVREYDQVVPVFVIDKRLIDGRYRSPRRVEFMFGCVAALDEALRKRGGRVVVLDGRPEQELPKLARTVGADAVLWTSDVSPFAQARDRRVTEALRAEGVRARPCPGNFAIDISKLRTSNGDPYQVFSPFHRAWARTPRRPHAPTPRALKMPDLAGVPVHHLPHPPGYTPRPGVPVFPPGEEAGRKAMGRWLSSGIEWYGEHKDLVGEDGTSALSHYFRWGCISPLEAEDRAAERGGPGAQAWMRQLCWRDFFAHVLLHWPEVLDLEFQPRLRGLEWDYDDDRLAAWQQGQTGYPLVDAAMRQLQHTGWMHNRARMVVGSFLTKDLHLDWRDGEAWFSRHLLDGEPTQNNGNWQWIASVGIDPAPVSRRLFNPTTQAKKFDADGRYIRQWVPELGDVPTDQIHEPWTMNERQQRDAKCRIGSDYPEPIVDHAHERRRALELYAAAREVDRGGRSS